MKKLEYKVYNLQCAGCAAKIQDEISHLENILESNLDIYSQRLLIEAKEELDTDNFFSSINKIADKIEPGTYFEIPKRKSSVNKNELHDHSHHGHHHEEVGFYKKYEKFLIITGIIFFIGSLFYPKNSLINKILSLIAYIILGGDVVYKSFLNIKRKNFLDENFLMTIATFGAFYLGETTEAVGVMLFYKIGEYFQDLAVDKSRNSIKSLVDIKPQYAHIKDQSGNTIQVSPESLQIGDTIIVRAGEKIPVDGVIIKGESTLDTSTLTGESLPYEVSPSSQVLSGSINGNNLLEIEVQKLFVDSAVSKIIQMVEDSSIRKAQSEKFITKFARYYTPLVVLAALIVAFIVPSIIGNYRLWIGRALIFLVISCPCALVISVPLTFFSSIGKASRKGILIKGGNYLEKLTEIEGFVFDKTGTLTKGTFKVDKLEPTKDTPEELLNIAQIGEFHSTHPIGKAIMAHSTNSVNEDLIKNYKEIPGHGTFVEYGEDKILIGNKKLMDKYNISVQENDYVGTILFVAKNNEFVGKIYISDEIKEDSQKTIEYLNNKKIDTFMLTGDSRNIAEHIGTSIGIRKNDIFYQLLPQDKVKILEEIKGAHKKGIAFVGDGVNDAPSLALADVSIGMGNGSDLAIETADIVLVEDKPSKIIELLEIAKYNKKVLVQNIVFALGIKLIIMILGVFGYANMWMAIFADVGVSLLAILNAMKINIKK